ncbi:MAG: ROK family protein [Chloroflexi bacterium]|nr:ROK family protein [Chloroflexota bacterium]
MMNTPLYGAVEGGGTKFVCALGNGPDQIVARTRIDTTGPAETLGRVADFLREASRGYRLAAVGVACFGPLELDERSPAYGTMLETPKPGWSGAPIIAPLRQRLGVPVALDTDVSGAALAEWRWGAAQGCDPALYLTVGTGIGGGAVVGGRPLHGLLHPEMGHIPAPRLAWPDGRPDDFPGVCPFHGNCFEGMASGPALQARLGAPAETAGPEHPVWDLEAGYIASAVATYVLVLSPQRLVAGGGVMQQAHLIDRVRQRLPEVLAGYVKRAEVDAAVERYVVAPHFGQDAGLMGAFALAMNVKGET